MHDIINLNSIRSDSCNCNKPKNLPVCGCNSLLTYQAMNLNDQYFKVKNLFGELKSEWQRTEARSNLGITDIIDLRQIQFGEHSEDPNIWQMTTSKSGDQKVYQLVVKNGEKGESATIEIVSLDCELAPDAAPVVRNLGTENHAQYMIKLPKGKRGENGAPGESAFAIANRIRKSLHLDPFETEEAWLASLKGIQGEPGNDGDLVESIELIDYGHYTKTFLNNLQLSAKMFIWRITWKSGKTADIWVPENTGEGPVTPVATPTFLYKLITFSNKPKDSDFRRTLDDLYAEVNKDSSGRSVEYLIENKNWRKTAPVISQPGYEFIYMATSVITEDNVGLWSVVQLTGALGEEGSNGQGVISPVIRMRGSWSSDNCYVNLSNLTQNGTELRFIDIVVHNGEYWMVSPSVVRCAEGAPSNSNANWIKAVEFDFTYINTLIANYIKNHTLDTSEVRIHKVDDWDNPTDDKIVAGMTSGRPVNDWESNNNNTGDPIRIWAGTKVDVLDNNGNNVSYTLNLEDAKFKVRQSGKLEASDANIEGIVLANTLRLGKLNANNDNNGTFELASSNNVIVLPSLPGDLTQMFYLLTNFGYSPKVQSRTGDSIQTPSGTTINSSGSYQTSLNKLYLCFGFDHTWYIIELDVLAASSIIDNSNKYGLKYLGIVIKDKWTHTTEQGESTNGYVLETLNIKGTLYATFKNETSKTLTLTFEPQIIKILYDARSINPTLLTVPATLPTISVKYELLLDLGTISISPNTDTQELVNGGENYATNTPGVHIRVNDISFNGTLSNSFTEIPTIGTVIVQYPVTKKLGTQDNYTKIELTGIPFTQND